jgi:hypothetical protein
MISVTAHAVERGTERFNWSKSQLIAKSITALEVGHLITDDPFLVELFHRTVQYYKHNIYYYNEGVVFVFDDDRLITVFPLTGRFKKGEKQ